MKRLTLVLLVAVLSVAMFASADAQLALRAGGGMIFDGSQPGGHVSLILPFSDKPAGLMVAGEYYKKSGITTIPVSARGLYNLDAGESADIYLGLGTGIIYSKADLGIVSTSSTKMLFSAVGGLKFNTSETFGFFGELSLERALTDGADNNLAGKAGVAITFID